MTTNPTSLADRRTGPVPDPLQPHPSQSPLDALCINTIRCLAMDAVQKANSGHPGMPMGMAAAGYRLWTSHLRHNPRNPKWANRDRFVLSNGHGCMLLYSLLHLTGYDLPMTEIEHFRQWGSRTPGHPEYGHTPGVELTTGPLGQGISNAVGMAIAERYLAAYFNRDGFPIIDYRIFVFAGDGCLQEGISSEACSLAGHLGLDNLLVVYDDNRITIDGPTGLSFTEDVGKRFDAYGWSVRTVPGENLAAFDDAVRSAFGTGRPTLVRLQTHIGYGSPNKQDSHEAHGSPLGEEEVALTKERLGWDPAKKFFVPPEAYERYGKERDKGERLESAWKTMFREYAGHFPDPATELEDALAGRLRKDWEQFWRDSVPAFDSAMATRQAQGKVLDAVMPGLPLVLGGSADLTPSNNTRFKGAGDFSKQNRLGRYIRYGVREHAMAAIMNGMSVSNLIPYGGTFLTFSDYMRPSVRLAALSGYPSIFAFTHDSIGLGEDGPTHQAVEHLSALRAIPGLVVLRPADANETAYAWKFALENRTGPTLLALTRQKVPLLDQSRFPSAENLFRGAYVLTEGTNPVVILIATGSEVGLALEAYDRLMTEGINARVVSMPSWELFERQPAKFREEVLPNSIRARVAIEAGVVQGWEKYLGESGAFVGMSSFGASAPAEDVFRGFGITVENIVKSAKKVLQ